DIGRYGLRPVVTDLQVPLGGDKLAATIFEGRLGEMVVYFVDCPQLYDRDGMFGFGDDDARSVYFCRAVLEMMPALDFFPDVVHVHDWYAALIPNMLDRVYDRDPYSEIATTLTIHNLSAQGVFGFGALVLAGLQEWGLIRLGIPGLDNVVNFLGRGIHFADVVNTVSERYAKEIQTPEYGEGLDELLRRNTHKLHGILNGIDYEIFDPQKDPNIPHHYSADAPQQKSLNRAALRTELGLEDVSRPVCAIVSRFFAAVVRGAENFRHPSVWTWLVQHAMREDVSWSRSALKYVQLYLAAIAARRERRGVPVAAPVSPAPVGE